MKIAVLGTSRSGTDPRIIRLAISLAAAGNDVTFLSPGTVDPRIDAAVSRVISIDTRWPSGSGSFAGPVRRRNPSGLRKANMHRRAVALLEELNPDLVYVSDSELVALVDGLGFTIASDMKFSEGITNDLATVAPRDPVVAGLADARDTPWVDRSFTDPVGGRHRGKRVVLCYNPTDTTPARYLHAALERAGVTVYHRYPAVDLSAVTPDVDSIIFVESPYPAVEVTGETSIPVLYWVHHGEIHLYQNIRLAQRYRADAVLLAHSWHLAHRFSAPVFRFPFAVPTEMLVDGAPFDERTLDVSMVAAGFDDTGRRYAVRRGIADAFTQHLGRDRVRFTGGLSPAEMFSTYANSRVVIDEGGSLHRPITMRVFEATGSGAALMTEPAPGIELLFDPDTEFVTMDASSVGDLLPSPDTLEAVALAGNARAFGVHTYDHRVDELFSTLDSLSQRDPLVGRTRSPARLSAMEGGLAGPDFLEVVGRYGEIDSIACREAATWFASTSYLIWSHDDATERSLTVDAVVVDDAAAVTEDLLERAHRFVFSSSMHAPTVATMLTHAGRTYVESTTNGVHVFDFATPGYIVRGPS